MQKTIYLFLLGFFFVGLTHKATAQLKHSSEATPKSMILLHDGSVYIGPIIGEDDYNLSMMLSTQDTISMSKGLIKRIRRGEQDIVLHEGGRFNYIKGWFVSLELLSLGTNTFDNATTQAALIAGYRLNKKFSVGIGTGISYFYTNRFNTGTQFTWLDAQFFPMYAYGRYYPFDTKVRPFVFTKAGYGFPDVNFWGTNHSGGAMFEPGIGVHFSSKRDMRIILAIGQALQHTNIDDINFDQWGNPVETNASLWFNRTVFKFILEWR